MEMLACSRLHFISFGLFLFVTWYFLNLTWELLKLSGRRRLSSFIYILAYVYLSNQLFLVGCSGDYQFCCMLIVVGILIWCIVNSCYFIYSLVYDSLIPSVFIAFQLTKTSKRKKFYVHTCIFISQCLSKFMLFIKA